MALTKSCHLILQKKKVRFAVDEIPGAELLQYCTPPVLHVYTPWRISPSKCVGAAAAYGYDYADEGIAYDGTACNVSDIDMDETVEDAIDMRYNSIEAPVCILSSPV